MEDTKAKYEQTMRALRSVKIVVPPLSCCAFSSHRTATVDQLLSQNGFACVAPLTVRRAPDAIGASPLVFVCECARGNRVVPANRSVVNNVCDALLRYMADTFTTPARNIRRRHIANGKFILCEAKFYGLVWLLDLHVKCDHSHACVYLVFLRLLSCS